MSPIEGGRRSPSARAFLPTSIRHRVCDTLNFEQATSSPPKLVCHVGDHVALSSGFETVYMRLKDLYRIKTCLFECAIELIDYDKTSPPANLEIIGQQNSFIKGPLLNKNGDIVHQEQIGHRPESLNIPFSPNQTFVSLKAAHGEVWIEETRANHPDFDSRGSYDIRSNGYIKASHICVPRRARPAASRSSDPASEP